MAVIPPGNVHLAPHGTMKYSFIRINFRSNQVEVASGIYIAHLAGCAIKGSGLICAAVYHPRGKQGHVRGTHTGCISIRHHEFRYTAQKTFSNFALRLTMQ